MIKKRRRNKFLQFIYGILYVFLLTSVFAEGSYYYNGKVAVSQRKYDEALKLFDQALKKNPKNGNVLFYKGYVYEKLNKLDQANEFYLQAVEFKIENDLKEKAFWKIVLYLDNIGDWTQLKTYSEQFLNFREYEHVKKLQEKAVFNENLSLPKIANTIATVKEFVSVNNYESAIRLLKIKTQEIPDAYILVWHLAKLLMDQDDYESAIPYLKRLIQAFPHKWQYGYKLAVCYFRSYKYKQSLRAIKSSRKTNREQSKEFIYFTTLLEGKNHVALGNYSQARVALEATQKQNSKSLVHRIDLGESYYFLKKYSLANTYSKSLYSKKKNIKKLSIPQRLRAYLLWYRLAVKNNSLSRIQASALSISMLQNHQYGKSVASANNNEKDVKESIKDYLQKSKSIYAQDYVQAMLTAGKYFNNIENWQKGLLALEAVEYNKLLSQNRNDYYLHYGQALYRVTSDVKKSLYFLKKADDSSLVHYYRGLCYAKMKKSRNALKELQSIDENKATWMNLINKEPAFITLAQQNEDFRTNLLVLSNSID